MTTAPLPNTAGSTEGATMETPTPDEPFNLSQEVGKGFLGGGVLGSAYYLARGGGMQALCTQAPGVSVYCAVWSGAYAGIQHARRKEDTPVLNSVLAAGGAYGIAALPRGLRAAGRCTLIGGAIGGGILGGLQLFKRDRTRSRNLSLQQPADR